MKTSLKMNRYVDTLMLRRDAARYGTETFPAESFLVTSKEAVQVIIELQELLRETSAKEARR